MEGEGLRVAGDCGRVLALSHFYGIRADRDHFRWHDDTVACGRDA